MMAVSMMATAQDKISLNALQLVNRQQKLEQRDRHISTIDERITLVVKVADEGAVETYNAIRSAGGRIEGVLGQQAVVSIPVSGVQSIAALKGIERIDATHTGKPLTDISVKATKVSEILNKPAGAATSLNGKGVMVCIIDWGFNFTHAAFTDGNGNSRIKCIYLMDQAATDAVAGHKKFGNDIGVDPEGSHTLVLLVHREANALALHSLHPACRRAFISLFHSDKVLPVKGKLLNVDRSIDVPVMAPAALRTHPLPV